ncbi:MAG: adenylate/guanylate cyclase domain-containing protein [Bacteroidales bacterium]|nr:adenylate/guanylate cyclase domain-containing protein [Bacteroidales bacterium]
MRNKGIPRYHVLRIYLFSILIYFMLILPVLMVMSLKMAPKLFEARDNVMKRISKESDTLNQGNVARLAELERNLIELGSLPLQMRDDAIIQMERERDSLIKVVSPGSRVEVTTDSTDSPFSTTAVIIFRFVILFTLVAGLIANAPLKRYFNKKRRRKPIPEKLSKYCKRILLFTPYINAGILLVGYFILHGYMFYVLKTGKGFEDAISRDLFLQFFYVSLIAYLLIVLFVFFWQKHRVHIIYLEHVFAEKELYSRLKYLRKGRISNRLWISSGMTTLLPLVIVMLYIILALTPIRDLGTITAEHQQILLGPYHSMVETGQETMERMWYINAFDNLLMFSGISMGIIVALIYIMFFVRWTTAGILSPVKELLYNMRWTGEGHVNNYTVVRTNDEIGELSEGYNNMTSRLMEYIDRISGMNEAYVRFVPRQFLQFLGKDNFTDIKLGDQVQKEMTILFSDIRSFTDLSEEMTPKENFDFINHYLGLMEPVIRKNNGFIDKYIGDSIMALFGESVDDAINAAVEMRMKLVSFNDERRGMGKKEISIGIGIHAGNLMLGIVGSEGRMEGTVISDAVNLASRLEGLTKIYGASIIISEDALIKLKNPLHFQYRFLDIARVKGKRDSVYIFEVLNGDDENIKKLKWETRNEFGKAVDLYRNQKFEQATELFQDILKKNPADMVARLYTERCQETLLKGLPKDWSGVDMREN